MTPVLYPHQQDLKAKTRAALVASKSVLTSAPTGIGKTNIAVSIILDAIKKGSYVWFIAPRKELVKQTANCMTEWGIDFSFIAAGKFHNPYAQVQIVSLGSLANRLGKVRNPDLAIIDEIHFGGQSLDRLVNWLKTYGVYIIGLSASPWRLSGEGLGKYCDEMVCGPGVRWLIDNGYLSDYRLFAPTTPDLSGVKIVAGDYAKGQLADFMEHGREIIGDAVAHYKKVAIGKLNIAYCVSRKHSEITAEAFRAAGVPAMHMDGETPDKERAKIIRAFANREILTLTNCDLLTFGFDLSSASGIDVTVESMSDLRPTKSLALQLQKWGRVLRKKPDPAIILDHSNNCKEHGLPDQERKWTLEDREKRKSTGERSIPVRICSVCFRAYAPAPACPACGHVEAIQYREIKEISGELAEVTREQEIEARKKRMEVGRATTIAELRAIAKERGYKHGWIRKQAQLKGIRT